MTWSDMSDETKDEMLEEMEKSETSYQFGPFDPPKYCNFVYGGIDEECGTEATHMMVIEYRMETERLVRCDDHGFPMAVRARREQVLGHPLCQVCVQRDPVKRADPNDPIGTFETQSRDGEDMTAYACEECEAHFDLDLDPIDE